MARGFILISSNGMLVVANCLNCLITEVQTAKVTSWENRLLSKDKCVQSSTQISAVLRGPTWTEPRDPSSFNISDQYDLQKEAPAIFDMVSI